MQDLEPARSCISIGQTGIASPLPAPRETPRQPSQRTLVDQDPDDEPASVLLARVKAGTGDVMIDKANLDIFWIRDESLEETANLPEPDVLAADIVGDLGPALEQFRVIAEEMGE